jgi:hypothetical protein
MIYKRISVLAVIMTHGIIAMLSRRGCSSSKLLLARAFTTTAVNNNKLDTTTRRGSATTSGQLLLPRNHQAHASAIFPAASSSSSTQQRFLSSSTVEEDLDAALDNILGDVTKQEKVHMNGSKPMPKALVEQVRTSNVMLKLLPLLVIPTLTYSLLSSPFFFPGRSH